MTFLNLVCVSGGRALVKQSASMLVVGQYSILMMLSSLHSRSLWNAVSICRVFDHDADAVAHFMADLESSSAGVGCITGVPRSANRRRNHTMSRPRSRVWEFSSRATGCRNFRGYQGLVVCHFDGASPSNVKSRGDFNLAARGFHNQHTNLSTISTLNEAVADH